MAKSLQGTIATSEVLSESQFSERIFAKDTEYTTGTPALLAADAPARTKASNYPEPFAALVAGRTKRPLGDLFGLTNFGVNLICLPPGAISALHHRHLRQDEFIYVLDGRPTLCIDTGETQLCPGMVSGFPAGGTAHHLENRTAEDCVVLEIGDRTTGDQVSYPNDDIKALMDEDGRWQYAHKDGTPY
ncbi:cupin domain-containing protein [Lipomyces kononenkoae]|uniref:Cupin domain-containing protein n=1 Tax=Lipomyces kononenkoae TaxID=34357 RepID=A0ACC3SVC5_LIPKO